MNKLLFVVSVIFFPLWSLPFLPGTYSSPFHLFLFSITPLVLLANKVPLNKIDLIWLAFFIFSLLFGLIAVLEDEGLFSRSVIGAFAWSIYIFAFVTFKVLVRSVGLAYTINAFSHVGKVLVLFGTFELLVKLLGLESAVRPFNIFFSGHVSGRLQLTTSEASWAVQILLILLPFMFHRYSITNSKLDLCFVLLCSVLIISCLSMTGILIMLIAVFLYSLLFTSKWFYKFLYYGLVSFVVFYLVYIWILSLDSPPYYLSRFLKLVKVFQDVDGQKLFVQIISIDDSLFVRFGYPFVALTMWIDNPLGVGLNNFGFFFPDYLKYLSVDITNKQEVIRHIENLNADPRNLFLKILVENGVVCFCLFIMILAHCIRWLKYSLPNRNTKLLRYIFVIMLGMMMQFSTPYFACYIIVFSILSANYANQRN